MNKSLYILFFIGISILFLSASDGVAEIQNKDRTGTPDGDQNCTECHNDGNFASTININVNDSEGNPVDTYIPGEVYNISYIVTSTGNPNGYGFQSTVLYDDLSNAGELTSPSSNAQLESVTRGGIVNRHMVEHNAPSPTGFFNVDWEAPDENGDITFYASGNVVNGDDASDGDRGTPSITKVLSPDPTIGINDLNSEVVEIIQNEGEITIISDKINSLDGIDVFTISGQRVVKLQEINLPYSYSNMDNSKGIHLFVFRNQNEIVTKKVLF